MSSSSSKKDEEDPQCYGLEFGYTLASVMLSVLICTVIFGVLGYFAYSAYFKEMNDKVQMLKADLENTENILANSYIQLGVSTERLQTNTPYVVPVNYQQKLIQNVNRTVVQAAQPAAPQKSVPAAASENTLGLGRRFLNAIFAPTTNGEELPPAKNAVDVLHDYMGISRIEESPPKSPPHNIMNTRYNPPPVNVDPNAIFTGDDPF